MSRFLPPNFLKSSLVLAPLRCSCHLTLSGSVQSRKALASSWPLSTLFLPELHSCSRPECSDLLAYDDKSHVTSSTEAWEATIGPLHRSPFPQTPRCSLCPILPATSTPGS